MNQTPIGVLTENLSREQKIEFLQAVEYLHEAAQKGSVGHGENGIGGIINKLSPAVREVFQLFSTMLETPRIAPFTPKMTEADYANTLGMVPENVETLKAALDHQEVLGKLQAKMGTDRDRPPEPISRREQVAAALEASNFPDNRGQ